MTLIKKDRPQIDMKMLLLYEVLCETGKIRLKEIMQSHCTPH